MKHLAGRIFIFLLFIALAVFLFCYARNGSGNNDPSYLPLNPLPETPDVSDSEDMNDPAFEEKYPEPTFSLYHYLESFPAISQEDGYALTDAVYDEDCSLFIATPGDDLLLPGREKYTVEGTEFFTLWPRMGYIILADGTQKKILSPEGDVIPVPEGCDLSFFPARTKEDFPLFRDWSANGKYVTLSFDGTVTDASYDERLDSRGCAFDYPSYYGKSDSDKHTVNYSGGSREIIVNQIIKKNYVRIEVVDFGRGISEHILPYIWERYYKDTNNHIEGIKSSGLGLSIVKTFVEAHGGSCGVTSKVGKGSTFWFEINL